MKIRFDANMCTGCAACQMACLDQRDIQTALGRPPLRYVITEAKETAVLCRSIGCVHCGTCAEVCPQACISRNELGFVVLDSENCIGCGKCEKVCPLHVISSEPETGKALKCDGCMGRILDGRLPACVHTCPTGALWLERDR